MKGPDLDFHRSWNSCCSSEMGFCPKELSKEDANWERSMGAFGLKDVPSPREILSFSIGLTRVLGPTVGCKEPNMKHDN